MTAYNRENCYQVMTMPKSENQKFKALFVAKYLQEYSDENHAVSATDIIDYLSEECGIMADRRSIYRLRMGI